MAIGAKAVLLSVLVAMVAAIVPRSTESVVTCQLVITSLTPCVTFLVKGGQVPQKCCDGVKSLYKDADTTTDRQTACRCLEETANMVHGLNMNYANDLPGKCDVHIPYKISRNLNCST
ncbi:non-specific lipid-transfer protein 1-like [Rutidosis leptorrhynchoides]|uniref:non-specific lipid-transfer protein 1-like n=1 Tax=Rutidosis leptorrhynchoides TaxID=125765 RepID=UPI003A99FD4C